MTEEVKQTEMVEKPQEQPAQETTEMVTISATELEQIRSALKKANGEAAKYRKTAEQVEAERKAKEEAEMTALQKAEAHAKELEARIAQIERQRVQAEVAAKVGLPAILASRLQGETPEEMEEDAKAIIETLPKQTEKPKSPGPLNPGVNGSPQGETDDQRRKRLIG